jgi:bifunctional DNA-binding transcriptional regulator/antitoxin component of YhaV-PrlF toxin-antitoxin module
MMETTIQVRQRGTLTLPAELREKYGIQPGDTFRLVDLDGVFVLTPMVPMAPELAREIERARLDADVPFAGAAAPSEPAFRLIGSRYLRVVRDPEPARGRAEADGDV